MNRAWWVPGTSLIPVSGGAGDGGPAHQVGDLGDVLVFLDDSVLADAVSRRRRAAA